MFNDDDAVLIEDHDLELAPPSLMDNKQSLENEFVDDVANRPVKRAIKFTVVEVAPCQ